MGRLIPWLLLLVLAGTGGGYWLGRQHGEAAEAARRDRQAADLFRAAVVRAASAGDALRAIGERLAAALEASHHEETETVRTIVQVIHENPEFAATSRPVELDRLRREQLEAIARAVEPDQL